MSRPLALAVALVLTLALILIPTLTLTPSLTLDDVLAQDGEVTVVIASIDQALSAAGIIGVLSGTGIVF